MRLVLYDQRWDTLQEFSGKAMRSRKKHRFPLMPSTVRDWEKEYLSGAPQQSDQQVLQAESAIETASVQFTDSIEPPHGACIHS